MAGDDDAGPPRAPVPLGATAERVARWLAGRAGTRWCASCLAAALALAPWTVRRALDALREARGVALEPGRCSGCAAPGLTVRVAGLPAPSRERAAACAGAAEGVQVGTLVVTVVPGATGPAYEVVFAPEGGPRTRLPAVRCEGPRALLRLLAALLGEGFWQVEALEELRREGATGLRGLAVAEARLRRAGLWPAGDPTSRD